MVDRLGISIMNLYHRSGRHTGREGREVLRYELRGPRKGHQSKHVATMGLDLRRCDNKRGMCRVLTFLRAKVHIMMYSTV